jgi:hypothetical protein
MATQTNTQAVTQLQKLCATGSAVIVDEGQDSFGTTDKLGRVIGAGFYIHRQEYTLADTTKQTFSYTTAQQHPCLAGGPGVYFSATIYNTRDGKSYQASRHVLCASLEAATRYCSAYMTKKAKEAAKKASAALTASENEAARIAASRAPKIHAFNTKRLYTAKGQRIAWTLLSTGNVAMVDIDRGIDYILVRGPWDKEDNTPVTNGEVMDLYDNNRSQKVWNEAEWKEAQTLQAALNAAAAAV